VEVVGGGEGAGDEDEGCVFGRHFGGGDDDDRGRLGRAMRRKGVVYMQIRLLCCWSWKCCWYCGTDAKPLLAYRQGVRC
jgi:hypothetical protein